MFVPETVYINPTLPWWHVYPKDCVHDAYAIIVIFVREVVYIYLLIYRVRILCMTKIITLFLIHILTESSCDENFKKTINYLRLEICMQCAYESDICDLHFSLTNRTFTNHIFYANISNFVSTPTEI